MKQYVQKPRKNRILIIVSVLFVISLFIPTPFYLFQPGSVEELSSKVTVEAGEKREQGHLYLTTVLSIKASNIYYLAYGLIAPHTAVQRSQTLKGEMTDEEYSRWLDYLMESSQMRAVTAGLRAAGEDVKIIPKGMVVRSISPESKAQDNLQAGDIIMKVDDRTIHSAQDHQDYFIGKKAGDFVSITFTRDGKEMKKKVELIPLPNSPSKVGIGVVLEEYVELNTEREVKIQAGEIGGPSAGFMFSLEVYRQLKDGDITKGYEIAGTGTIDEDGKVGQIGGIREKIAAVDKAGIDLFFCPKDVSPGDTNEKEVKAEAEKYGYSVEIVPVKSLEEAVAYLDSLPPKS